MPGNQFSEQQISQLVNWVAGYIGEQRAAFYDKANPLGLRSSRNCSHSSRQIFSTACA